MLVVTHEAGRNPFPSKWTENSSVLRGRRGKKNRIDTRWGAGDDVLVDHQVGEPAVPLRAGVGGGEVDDGVLFRGSRPMVAGTLAVASWAGRTSRSRRGTWPAARPTPAEQLGLAGNSPWRPNRGRSRRPRPGRPAAPTAWSEFPKIFFNWTCSSISSDRTFVLPGQLPPSNAATFWSFASAAAVRERVLSNVAALLPKNVFCHW